MYENDKRIVLTLDAGGTNFVFSAIRGNIQIVSPVCMPSCSDNLDRCLATLVAGFDAVIKSLDTPPVAISYGAQNETYIEGWEKKTSNLLIYKRLCNV